jgi:ParB/RepB/Spo0J family partition protein
MTHDTKNPRLSLALKGQLRTTNTEPDNGEFESTLIGIDLIDESNVLRLRHPPYPGIPALAEDIQRSGQSTPLFVRPTGERYELISGYRRLAALKLISAPTAWCRIYRDLSDSEAYLRAISENEARDSLSDLERAEICARLQRDGMTADQIATHMKWANRRNVHHHLRVLKESSSAIRQALQARQIALHVALALIDTKAAELGETTEREILTTVIDSELSIRETKNHVARVRRAASTGASTDDPAHPMVNHVREFKNGLVALSLRLDPRKPEEIDGALASLEIAMKKARQMKRKLKAASSGTDPSGASSTEEAA